MKGVWLDYWYPVMKTEKIYVGCRGLPFSAYTIHIYTSVNHWTVINIMLCSLLLIGLYEFSSTVISNLTEPTMSALCLYIKLLFATIKMI